MKVNKHEELRFDSENVSDNLICLVCLISVAACFLALLSLHILCSFDMLCLFDSSNTDIPRPNQ